jgi:hypothetical protein
MPCPSMECPPRQQKQSPEQIRDSCRGAIRYAPRSHATRVDCESSAHRFAQVAVTGRYGGAGARRRDAPLRL